MPSPATRRVRARLTDALPVEDGAVRGVRLRFAPERSRIVTDAIEHFADLGPEWCMPAVGGLGAVLRVLRAARIAAPAEPKELLGDPERCCELLLRAKPVGLVLDLEPRSRIRFTAWTDEGVETIDDVHAVVETDDAWYVARSGDAPSLRIARENVVRQQTECERYWRVVDIERAP